MILGLTGASGFLGRSIVAHLVGEGHALRCWTRAASRRDGFEPWESQLTWVMGDLSDPASAARLVEGCDAVIHAALDRPRRGFMGSEGELIPFVERNVLGSLRLIEESRAAGVPRFLFVSTCAVHDVILEDRPLDEAHPLWPRSHDGAHKAAIEAFVHSFGLGHGYAIAALRPTGIYGLAHPASDSKWFDLVGRVVRGEDVVCHGGGKEVHAEDVARALGRLLTADGIAGQAYSCYDRYVSHHEVATIAREITGSAARIIGDPSRPKYEIGTEKLRALGVTFGGRPLLERTIAQLVAAHHASP